MISCSCDYNPMISSSYPEAGFPENDIILQDPFLFTFPNSPLEYDNHLQFLHLSYDQHQSITSTDDHHVIITNMAAAAAADEEDVARNKMTSSKKDRHSKINTARGPRDRRMRLSLEVARKFFDLQDLLGYDKPSKTLEWLLKESTSAITDLITLTHHQGTAPNSTSITSSISDDCEAISSEEQPPLPPPTASTKSKKTKKIKVTVPRESRRKARERARERTSQKRRLSTESSTFTRHIHHDLALAEVQDLSSDDAAPSIVFHYPDNQLFQHQHEQIAEFQFCGKPWEAYNTCNLSG